MVDQEDLSKRGKASPLGPADTNEDIAKAGAKPSETWAEMQARIWEKEGTPEGLAEAKRVLETAAKKIR